MVQDHQVVARDFMGLSNIGNMREKGDGSDCITAVKLRSVDIGDAQGAVASLNTGTCFNSTSFPGLKHPLWNNCTAFQHTLSSRTLQEEKPIEQSAETVPERSYLLMHAQQAQGWWHGEPMIKGSPTAGTDDFSVKAQVVCGFGAIPKNALSLPLPNLHALAGHSEAAQRTPAVGPIEKKGTAPLTIFYGGSVNVFNDIPAEKVQAIMFLASTGSLKATSSASIANANAVKLPMTSSVHCSSPVTKASPISQQNSTTINMTTRIQKDQGDGFPIENTQTALNQCGLGNASTHLDTGYPGAPPPCQEQPVFPTALPQARKASLARFLERRRERIHLKSPYPLKHMESAISEERFSSSNDIALYKPYYDVDEKKKISIQSWMERQHEFASDMIVKEDTKIISV